MAGIQNYSEVSGNAIFGNQLPYSQQAEEALLGALLVDPEALPKVIEVLKPESFYKPQHQKLFTIMTRMFSEGRQEDIVSIIDESVKMGIFDNADMANTYLSGLLDRVPASSNIESYCAIIEEKARIRSLLQVASNIIENSNNGTMSASDMLDMAEQDIYNIRQGREIAGLSRLSEVMCETFAHLQELSGPDAKEHLGSTTGYSQLDRIITGLNKTDLIVLAARPAMGKSAFALNVAVNMCKSTNRDVVIFSLEMGKEQLAARMLASEALVNNSDLRTGELQDEDWTKLAVAADRLSALPIYLDDGSSVTVPQMKAKLRRMRNLGLVVIDYIQLMQSPTKNLNRVQEVSEITRQLKLMAKELNVPVIALSQLSRALEKRDDKRPMLSDLRESGSIEQDADIIMFLYRDAYYNDSSDDKSTAECIVAKNRHGQTNTVQLSWLGEFTLFRSKDFRNDGE